MAKRKKPSSHAREREFRKRQRELKKREKAALRLERRQGARDAGTAAPTEQQPDGQGDGHT